ncbi:helicase [Dermatophilus congolensis]|uniref:HelD family protein n=1 Tax=Dermatophilus congolensis TaxID=1863 RepID=UPI00312CA0BC
MNQRENGATDDILHNELATEQAYVDNVYAHLDAARTRADLVATEGMSRGRTDRTGDIRDEEVAGLFERDALVYNAGRRRANLERQDEGLVFGRLDMDHSMPKEPTDDEPRDPGAPINDNDHEIRYIGRLGVRDNDYEALVIDWRAPAAAPLYRATPTDPMQVVRRRVLRSRGRTIIGAEDDLMVTQPPENMPVLGEGALLAALSRSRTGGMRDIVATIQAHQDEAIRAAARGVTSITGGPGTGKTVVALHRAAYLLYSDRRKYEGGGVLVIGPSAAYTAYIERVLPSLGENSVSLRSLGDVNETLSATRLDSAIAAHVKGSSKMATFLNRAVRDSIPQAPTQLRTFVAGHPIRIEKDELDRLRATILKRSQRNTSARQARLALNQLAWEQVREGEREDFNERFNENGDVDTFLETWWRPIDPREVLLWTGDPERAHRYGHDLFTAEELHAYTESIQTALDTATWSVADIALIDAISPKIGLVPEKDDTERGFYEVELLEDAEAEAVAAGQLRAYTTSNESPYRERTARDAACLTPEDRRDILLQGRIGAVDEFAHVLIDEAQDISPMQWKMIGRRGRWASWTVVGDAAQASWPDAQEAQSAQEEAFGTGPRRHFHMTTNYRNAKEIFDVAAELIREVMPDADIPNAVRITGIEPVQRSLETTSPEEDTTTVISAVAQAITQLGSEVDGSIAVITPSTWASALTTALEENTLTDEASVARRVQILDAMTTKGLEYDATIVVDPDGIVTESPGGERVLYVALTRAAHRMHVLRLR